MHGDAEHAQDGADFCELCGYRRVIFSITDFVTPP
jgi:hypothetical protein